MGPRITDRTDKWNAWIALILALVLHGLIYYLFPWQIDSTALPRSQTYTVVYEAEPQPEEPRERFIETNPDLPSNEPDKTENFAARSQQAAQELPSDLPLSDTPFIDGDSDISQKVVSGDQTQIVPPTALPSPSAPAAADTETLPVPTVPQAPPQPEFIRQENFPEAGLDSLLAERDLSDEPVMVLEPSRSIPLNIDPTLPQIDSQQTTPTPVDTPGNAVPRPRPRVAPDVLYGEITKSLGRVPVRGNALNAKFNDYGEYLQQMYEVIGLQWFALNRSSRIIRDEIASVVVIEFAIDRYGVVTDLKVKNTTAGRAATLLCQDAIRSRAPFGDWTPDMVATLNKEERIIFHFNYR